MTEDFPRGGGVPLKRKVDNVEKKSKTFESKSETNQKAGEKKLKSPLDSSIWTKKLTAQDAVPGTLVLCCITSVADHQIQVEIADGLSGIIAVTSISKEYSALLKSGGASLKLLPEIYQIGELLVGKVIAQKSIHERKILELTIDPDLINEHLILKSLMENVILQASVKSVEDKGYVMNIGVGAIKAFLANKEAEPYAKQFGGQLTIGKSLPCVLVNTKGDDLMSGAQRLAHLSLNFGKVSFLNADSMLSKDQLIPFTVGTWTIEQALMKKGLIVKAGKLRGFIPRRRLSKPTQKLDEFGIGDEIVATIIFCRPNTRFFGLSVQPQFSKPQPVLPPLSIQIGDIGTGKVVETTMKGAVYFKSTSGPFCYAPVKNLHSGEKADTKYPQGSEHEFRVIGISMFDRLAYVSTKKTILRQAIVSVEDAEIGALVTSVVSKVTAKGVFGKIYNHIRTFIPRMHAGNVMLSPENMQEKFHVGDKLKCRVLMVEKERNRLILTHKQSLVESDCLIVSSYAENLVGQVAEGCIAQVSDNGILVVFYNNVKGWISRRDLNSQGVDLPQKHFFLGQIVQVKILKVNPEEAKMNLSLGIGNENETTTESPSVSHIELVEVKLTKRVSKGFYVEILPDHRAGFIPYYHMTDNVQFLQTLGDGYDSGEILKRCAVFSEGPIATITAKLAIVEAVEEGRMPPNFDGLEEGQILPGVFARKHPEIGCFIEFPGNLCGLATYKSMDPGAAEKFSIGQTVYAKIMHVDKEKRKFAVSLKFSSVFKPINLSVGQKLLRSFLAECERMRIFASKSPIGSVRILSELKIGQMVTFSVTERKESGAMGILAENGAKAFATLKHFDSEADSNRFEAAILDIDFVNKCVEVTCRPEIVKSIKNAVENRASEVKPDQRLKSTVLLSGSEFYLLLLHSHAEGFLAYMPGKLHVNDTKEAEKFSILNPERIAVICSQKFGQNTILVDAEVNLQKAVASMENSGEEGPFFKQRKHLAIGRIYRAKITEILASEVKILVEGLYPGRIHISEILDEPEIGENPLGKMKIGEILPYVKIIGFRPFKSKRLSPSDKERKFAECSLRLSKVASKRNSREFLFYKDDFKPRESLFVYLNSTSGNHIDVIVNPNWRGRVQVWNSGEDSATWNRFKSGQIQIGSAFKARILQVNEKQKHLELSFLPPDLNLIEKVCPAIFCSFSREKGAVLKLKGGTKGQVPLTEICDDFLAVEKSMKNFKPNQICECFVIKSANSGSGIKLSNSESEIILANSGSGSKPKKFFVSLRKSRISNENLAEVRDPPVVDPRDLQAGIILRGFVRQILAKEKILIELGAGIFGKLLENSHKMIELKVGQLVSVQVVENSGPQGIKLTLLAPVKSEPEENETEQDISKSEEILADRPEKIDNEENMQISATNQPEFEFAWTNSRYSMMNLMKIGLEPEGNAQVAENQEKTDEPSQKRRKTFDEWKEEEKLLHQKEMSLLDPSRLADSADDYDRMVMASPNSSLVWLRFMAYFMDQGEIAKAKAIGDRALKTINIREENERLNVWTALLNLELRHGTSESLQELFERAQQACDQFKIYANLLQIYQKFGKFEEANELCETILKKFKQNAETWYLIGEFFMEIKRAEKARETMQRALKSLPIADHVNLISRFSQFEFKYGDVERGRTLFENLLNHYPKRTDVWLVFIDMMTKYGSTDNVRPIFERLVALRLPPKKMKGVFKKWVEFEEKHGDAENLLAVKEKAVEFVENLEK